MEGGGQKDLLYLTFLGSPWFSASQGGRDLKTHQDYTLFAQPPFEDLCRRHQHQLVHLMLLVTGHCDFREFQAEQRVFQQNARCHVAKLIAGHIKLSISILSKLLWMICPCMLHFTSFYICAHASQILGSLGLIGRKCNMAMGGPRNAAKTQ